jgi:hypothetical protein
MICYTIFRITNLKSVQIGQLTQPDDLFFHRSTFKVQGSRICRISPLQTDDNGKVVGEEEEEDKSGSGSSSSSSSLDEDETSK